MGQGRAAKESLATRPSPLSPRPGRRCVRSCCSDTRAGSSSSACRGRSTKSRQRVHATCQDRDRHVSACCPRRPRAGGHPGGRLSPTNSALGRLWHIAVAVDGVGQLMGSTEERQGYGLPLLSGGRNASAVDLAERLVGRLYLLPLLLPRSLLLVDSGDTERLRGGRLVMKRHMDRLGGRATGGTRSIVVETVATGTAVTAGHWPGIFPIRHLAIVIRPGFLSTRCT